METITYTEARNNLKSAMDMVCKSRAPLLITRQNDEAGVLMSLEDYNSIMETLHLMRSPKNAARLLESAENVKKGEHLITPDQSIFSAE